MVTVTGASDDLIEVDGDIRAEFYATNDGRDLLAFSDGTLLSVEYDRDGMWRIVRLVEGTATMQKQEATDPDGDYTDHVALLDRHIEWVVCGRDWKRAGC